MHSGLTRIALTLTCAFAVVGAEPSDHWAFQPVTRPSVPDVSGAAWPRGALDYFVLAKLLENGMQPARPAGRRTLIRRVTLDLTGLPPTPGRWIPLSPTNRREHIGGSSSECWPCRVLVSGGGVTGSTLRVTPTPRVT